MALAKYRKKIDTLDQRIINLLNDRAKLSMLIGKEKLQKKSNIYAPDREKAVLARIKILNKGPVAPEALEAIYREIMSCSLSMEKTLHIAYLGPEGSFTHSAANKKFGSLVQYISCNSLLEVFQKVEYRDCDYGVVPIENSIEGAVTHTLDLLTDSELKICAHLMLKISHNLLSQSSMKKIKDIYSNPQVFGQCRNWLLKHLPYAYQIAVASTTQAIQIAAKKKFTAAIGPLEGAKIYGVPILKRNIQDIAHNTTRFLIISTQDVPPTKDDRTSIVFSIKDKVGALHHMLLPFEKNRINLTKIESRPSKQKAWDYYFFVDFIGHKDSPHVKRALAQLEDKCKFLKVLGSYPV